MKKMRRWRYILFAILILIVISFVGNILYLTYVQKQAVLNENKYVCEKEKYGNDLHGHQGYIAPSYRIMP